MSEPMRLPARRGGRTSRNDLPMHVTVGALLVRAGTEILLVQHRAYGILLQPGGLEATPTAFGSIMGAGGTGGLAGALLAPRIAARIGIGPTIIVGLAVSPLAQVPLLCAGPGLRWRIVLAATLAVQLSWSTASGTSQRSLRQAVCDPAFQSRM
ncbi:hypothetical protein ACF1GW_22365 [Streptomyces achromogenes]|uniref:hypothetical protein n=1 Tax=Streptomyces achromogenes TaxID=67255 RepID=UPI0036FF9AE6